ncbi:MAG: hypothetical protein KAT34_16655 [Candidatus Aminicenantes bacterium]|nr:hypothetical protein [Candidatus Aminicenantes bacterium]
MKKLILVIFIIFILVVGTSTVFADSADDYKVIKKVSKNKQNSGDLTWFRVEIIEKTGKKSKIKIKLPIFLVETLADCTEGAINLENKCKFNLKKVLADLKKYGPMTLVEIESDDADIRVWFE